MSSTLILGPNGGIDSGRDGYSITVTPTTSEGTSLVGAGGCVFISKDDSLSLYVNYGGTVNVSARANEFVAFFEAHTQHKTAYGKVTIDRPINVDLVIGNIDEFVAVVPAGQTSGTFTVELPIPKPDLKPQELREHFKANAAKARATATR